jgi:hypothetical protein
VKYSELRPGRIYFFLDDAANAVKIGFSQNVPQRFQCIERSRGSRLKLLGQVAGSIREERQLHARFAAHRIEQEWFTYEGGCAYDVDEILSERAV